MIIEDNIDLSKNIAYVLSKEGYIALVANDGETGFQKYLSERPDIIILDLGLPKLSGNAICRQIRRDCDDEKTYIIMLTGKNEDEDRIIGKVQGANVYMIKPFDMPDLVKVINKIP